MPYVGYCLACGRLRELACGKCAQCRRDDAVRAARRGRCRNGVATANPQGQAPRGDRSQVVPRGRRPSPRPDALNPRETSSGSREGGGQA